LARVSHIARNTLSFYREAASPVSVKLSEVLDSVLELFTRQIEDKALIITRRYEFDGEIQNYPGELRQVFSNLVLNAIDALSKNGELTLSVRACRHPRTGLRGVRVLVSDRGTGIAPENIEKLFEPFFTTKGERGTGLGLWVSQGIVQKQGGSIRVRSNATPQRSGSVFSVFVPSVGALERLHLTASASNAKTVQSKPVKMKRDKRDGTSG
jgi:two-component system CheB/CheR fusion protein